MSVKSSDETGLEGRWHGDDIEKIARFDRTLSQLEEPADGQQSKSLEAKTTEKTQVSYQPENNQPRPHVAMETASTDDPESDLKRKSPDTASDLYTSLLSNYNTSYFSGQPDHTVNLSQDHSSHGTLGSDSGIEMTPGDPVDVAKTLFESENVEAYDYMDISRGKDPLKGWGETDAAGLGSLVDFGPYLEKSPPSGVGPLGSGLDLHSFSNVENQSDKDQQVPGPPGTAGPVKITLTETPATPAPWCPPQAAVSERASILSLGLEGVPTVTLSEPEEDTPVACTPPLTEEVDSPLFQPGEVKPVCSAQDQSSATASAPSSAPSHSGMHSERPGKAGSPLPPALDQEGTSTRSCHAEMEPPASPQAPPSAGYTGTAPAPSPPCIQYSILREEREAELDRELIIESCDASFEESPKREQDAPSAKGRRADPEPATASSCATPCVAPPPAAVPKDETEGDFSRSDRSAEDGLAARPRPLAVPVAPDVRVEQPLSEEKLGKQRRASESRRNSERQTASPALLRGLDRQKAVDLLYWRDLKQTGLLFGGVLLLLFSLTQFSVVSVIAYLALAALSATISFRIYKCVLQAVQKTDEGHPFKSYLDVEISLSQEQIQKHAETTQLYVNSCLKELRKLFLVQDLVDSLKFAVLMWLLTYVGALFNGLTLMIMAVVSMFSVPVFYEKYQAQIDQYLGLVRTHVNCVMGKIQEKIPGAKRKAE